MELKSGHKNCDKYSIWERINNINYLKMLIAHSLTGDMTDDLSKDINICGTVFKLISSSPYATSSNNLYRDIWIYSYKEGNKLLLTAIEYGYSKDVFKEKYVVETPIFKNKYLNNLLIATFGLQKDFDKLTSEKQKGNGKGVN